MTVDALERTLSGRTRGPVIAPDHRLYDSARTLFNGMFDRRPRLIFRPADTDDLVAAVRWASESDVAIAVRGGGNSVAGHSMPDDGFVIDLSRWRAATVDPQPPEVGPVLVPSGHQYARLRRPDEITDPPEPIRVG